MNLFRFFAPAFLALIFCVASGLPVRAQQPAPVNPIQALIQAASPAPAATAPANPAPAPATAPAATPAAAATTPATDETDTEPQETFGTRALNLAITGFDLLRAQSKTAVGNFAALPETRAWWKRQTGDPKYQERWSTIGDDLLVIVGIPLAAALLLEFLLLPLWSHVRRRQPGNAVRRFAALVGLFALKMVPVIVFTVASLILLDQNETEKLPRLVVLNVVYALTMGRVFLAVIRGVLTPTSSALRVAPMTDAQAAYAYRWLCAFSLVIIYGYFIVDVARVVHVPASTISSFGNLLGLGLVLMTLVVIAQKRAFVTCLLRGDLSAAQPDLSVLESFRLWLARHWHILAMAYLIIGYLITALGVENGFALMLRGTILTLLILVLMRVLFHATDRWGKGDTTASSLMHHAILRFLMRLVIWVFALLGAAYAWGADIPALFATPFGQRVMGSMFSIGLTVIIVALIYEGCNTAIERNLNRRDSEGKQLQVSARLRTLLPMIRNTIFIVFAAIVGIVVLSEVGFNIGPVLAGAGIFGVAIGFGSQALVKDFLTGLFIVIENTIAIGDVVQIGTHSGTVEVMSVRTLRLRDSDGALHILPYGDVTQIVNMTKDFAFAAINIGVAYDTDLERAMNVLREVGTELQNDPIFKRVILEPIEIFGVDKLGDSSITLSARLRTRPGKQWDVRRMFLLKMKQRFDKEGIQIPFPTSAQINITPAK